MALNNIQVLVIPSASITNNSKVINLTGNIDAQYVYTGTMLVIGNNPVVGIVPAVSGTSPDVNGNSTITLKDNWTLGTITNKPMVGFNSIEGLSEAIRKARSTSDLVLSILQNHELLLNSVNASESIPINGVPTNFVPYKYLQNQVSTLVTSAGFADAQLSALEPRITTAETNLTTIEANLNAKVAATNTDALATAADKVATNADALATAADKVATNADALATAADKVATNTDALATAADVVTSTTNLTQMTTLFDSFDDRFLGTKTSDPTLDNDGNALLVGAFYYNSVGLEIRFYNGTAWDKPEAASAASAAAALTSETNAATSETNAANDALATAADKVATSADALATTADKVATNADVVITNADASNTTTNALNASASKVLAQQYANHPEDTLIPNTTEYSAFHWKQKAAVLAGGTAPDSLKFGGQLPSYYAAQTSLSSKVDKTTTINGKPLSANVALAKQDVGLGNIDNTSDLDKPISTATQTAINRNRILALAAL